MDRRFKDELIVTSGAISVVHHHLQSKGTSLPMEDIASVIHPKQGAALGLVLGDLAEHEAIARWLADRSQHHEPAEELDVSHVQALAALRSLASEFTR